MVWLRRGAWGVLEQGLYALAHMLANVLLARWLDADAYGVFASLFALFVLLTYLHAALVTDPMLVFARQSPRAEAYVATALRGQWLVAGVTACAAFAGGGAVWLWGDAVLARALWGFAVAVPCLLALWAVRRAFSALLSPRTSAIGGMAYLGGLSAVLWWLRRSDALSAASGYLAAGAVSLVVALGLWLCVPRTARDEQPALAEVARSHWRYGRWLIAMTPLRWAPLHLYYLALPLIAAGGVALSGVLRATMLLVAPVQHLQMACAALIVPALSERVHRGEPLPRGRLALVLVGLSAGYAALLWLLGPAAMRALYDGSVASPPELLRWLAAVPLITAAITVTQAELMARERPRAMLASYAAGSAVTFTLGLWLAATQGLWGVALGAIVACASILLVQLRAIVA